MMLMRPCGYLRRWGWHKHDPGTDSMGRYLLAAMSAEGIDCSHVVCDASQPTGFQFKGKVTDGRDPPVESHHKGLTASFMDVASIDDAWQQAVRRGAWIGARAVQVLGDNEGLPTRAELDAAGL